MSETRFHGAPSSSRLVMPAQAGIQAWIPAFARMTFQSTQLDMGLAAEGRQDDLDAVAFDEGMGVVGLRPNEGAVHLHQDSFDRIAFRLDDPAQRDRFLDVGLDSVDHQAHARAYREGDVA